MTRCPLASSPSYPKWWWVTPDYHIRNATPEHVLAIVPHLRIKDVEDIHASNGPDVQAALLWALSLSPCAWAAIDAEGVIAIWGVGRRSLLADVGTPWLVGTDRLVKKYRKPFLRLVDLFLDMIVEQFPKLEGYQITSNTERRRWLEWCGFKFERAAFGMRYSLEVK